MEAFESTADRVLRQRASLKRDTAMADRRFSQADLDRLLLLDDPIRQNPHFLEMCREHQARTSVEIRRHPPKPWLPRTSALRRTVSEDQP
jgi:hypothetical protein